MDDKLRECTFRFSTCENKDDVYVVDVGLVNKLSDDELIITTSVLLNKVDITNGISEIIDINRLSKFLKLLRVTSWVLKFIRTLKLKLLKKNKGGNPENVENQNSVVAPTMLLKANDIQSAKCCWIKDVQRSVIQNPAYDNLRYQLDLFREENDLIRCGSRLKHADIELNNRYPYLLSKNIYLPD